MIFTEIETIKKNQTEILELKKLINEMEMLEHLQ